MVSPLYISGEWIADVHAIYHGDKTFRKSEIYQNFKICGSFPQTLWCCGELCRKACSPPQMWVQDRMSPCLAVALHGAWLLSYANASVCTCFGILMLWIISQGSGICFTWRTLLCALCK